MVYKLSDVYHTWYGHSVRIGALFIRYFNCTSGSLGSLGGTGVPQGCNLGPLPHEMLVDIIPLNFSYPVGLTNRIIYVFIPLSDQYIKLNHVY